jgi:uncharacterized protein YbbC (DUF1343 family)
VAVLPGIDVLIRDDFKALQGHRVGLITNHTGLTLEGMSTIDVLHQAAGMELKSLFGPEHGIRGEFDEKIKDAVDVRTGLPVYSLYGETMKPKPEHLKGLSALVFDIQDIGCRFYTFISTLGYALQAAAENKIRMVVLDRPNPITGVVVEGPVSDADRLSFTAWHPIPVRHGMTVGELARLFNSERKLGAALTVVPCAGWRRNEWFDATGLTWSNPSPNMRSLTEATLYPGIGLLETTNVSVGRGTDTPFEVIGAPWMDGRRLAERLNGRGLLGVRFIPIRFTPRSSVHQGAACGGVNIIITNRERYECLRTGIEIAAAIRDLFAKDWKIEQIDRLLVNRRVFGAFRKGAGYDVLQRLWKPDLDAFLRMRGKYLLYT